MTDKHGCRQITDDELDQILTDHWKWFESNKKEGSRADLSKCDLTGDRLRDSWNRLNSNGKVTSEKINLSQALFEKAILKEAHLEGADLMSARLDDADLEGAHLEGAKLARAHLKRAKLAGAHLDGAILRNAEIEGAHLGWANLNKADLAGANLKGTILTNANISGANLMMVDIKDAYLTGIIYNKTETLLGARIAECFGDEGFVRFANDQAWLEDFIATRNTPWQKFWAGFWKISSDYGRSFIRWALLSSLLVIGFALLFLCLGPEAFAVSNLPHDAWFERLGCMIYYSVVTFTTLGFGDVVPKTFFAAALVMAEVITGYIMLGGLISILANKFARRS